MQDKTAVIAKLSVKTAAQNDGIRPECDTDTTANYRILICTVSEK